MVIRVEQIESSMDMSASSVQSERYLFLFEKLTPLIGEHDVSRICVGACRLLADLLQVEACSIFLYDPPSRKLRLRAATHIPQSEWKSVKLPTDSGLCGAAFTSREAVLLRTPSDFAAFEMKHESRYGEASCVVVPLIVGGRTRGVVNVANQKSGRIFNEQDMALLQAAARVIAGAIDNAERFQESQHVHQRLEEILENLHVGVIAFDCDLRVQHVNQRCREMISRNGMQIRGRHLKKIIQDPHIYSVCKRLINDSMAGGETVAQDSVRGFLGEREGSYNLSASRMNSSSGGECQGLLMIEDVGQDEEIARLRRAESIKSGFLRTISHELRTPLTVIRGTLPLLQKTTPNGSAGTTLDKVKTLLTANVDRLSGIVNTLLDVVEIDNGTLQMTRLAIDVNEVVRSRLPAHKLDSDKKRLHWNVDLDPNLPPVMGDAQRIGQSLRELFDNAVKFSPEGATINIRTRREDDMAVVHIGNYGPPIPRRERATIFEKFYQADQSTTRKCGGCGLGLYLAFNVAALHHGSLEIVDGEEGETAFLLKLPLRVSGDPA